MLTIIKLAWLHLPALIFVTVPLILIHKFRHRIKLVAHKALPLSMTGHLSDDIPRLNGMPLLGRMLSVLSEDGPMHNMTMAVEFAEQHHKNACYYWAGPQLVVVMTDIALIKQCLKTTDHTITRNKAFNAINTVLGENIFSAPLERWQPRRDAAKVVFSSQAMKNDYSLKFEEVIANYISKIKPQHELNLSAWANDLMMDITLATMLGISLDKLDDLTEEKHQLTDLLCSVFHFRKIIVFDMPSLISFLFFNKDRIKSKKTQKKFYDVLHRMLRKVPEINENVSLLIQEFGKALGRDNIYGDILALLFGGPDSSVSTFISIMRCLDAEPKITHQLTEEIIADQDMQAYIRSEKNLLAKVIKEALRLYPPFIFLTRGVDEPYQYQDAKLPVGTILFFPILQMQRLERIWGEDAIEFIPERWDRTTPEQLANYMPFGYGAQNCIAKGFALQVIKQLIYTLVKTHGLPKLTNNDTSLTARKNYRDVTIQNGGALRPKQDILSIFN